jgi:hypothetical protein
MAGGAGGEMANLVAQGRCMARLAVLTTVGHSGGPVPPYQDEFKTSSLSRFSFSVNSLVVNFTKSFDLKLGLGKTTPHS